MKTKIFALCMALALALSLTACGSSQVAAPDVDLGAFYTSLLENGDWPEMISMEDEALNSFYPGLLDLEIKQCSAACAAISSVACEIAMVEVENASDAKTVEEIFQARIDYQVGDGNNPGGAWYPEAIESWEKTAQIVTQGNFVLMAAGDCAGDAVESFNGLFA